MYEHICTPKILQSWIRRYIPKVFFMKENQPFIDNPIKHLQKFVIFNYKDSFQGKLPLSFMLQ